MSLIKPFTMKDLKNTKEREFSDLSKKGIGYAIEVHKTLGVGLLESTYQQCLAHELSLNQISFKMACPLPVQYTGTQEAQL
jgi:GxxExxY protein